MNVSKKKAKAARRARRETNRKNWPKAVPLPPSERPIPEGIDAGLAAQLARTDNVFDIPLHLLKIHPVHGDRNPYHDTPEGFRRRKKCEGHIRAHNGWSQTACEVLTVAVDEKGLYWIINGGGRLYMADVLSNGLAKVLPCKVLRGLTDAQIRALFKIMGREYTRVSEYDLWRANQSARGPEGDAVRAILEIKKQFGNNMPNLKLPTLKFGYAIKSPKTREPVLQQAVALVNNTALGGDRKLANIMTNAVIAILGTNGNVDEDRFRHVLPREDRLLMGSTARDLIARARRAANSLGYGNPHARTIAWQVAIIIVEEKYNPRFGDKLNASALDKLPADPSYTDAYSSAFPKAKKKTTLRAVA